MEIDNPTRVSPEPAPQVERGSSPVRKIFLNAEGLRAGWRFLIYMAFLFVFMMAFKMLMMRFLKSTPGVFSVRNLFVSEVISFCAAFGAAILMSFIEKRQVGEYGLPVQGAFGKLFWQGCLLGLAEISALIGLIHVLGGYSFGSLDLHGAAIFHWATLWGICFVFVGLFEEFLFRGYTLFTLSTGMGFWPAAVLLSAIFASVHLQNNGEGRIGVLAVFVVGMLWCLTIRRTGSLWFAVGMHAAFDYGETFLYSVPDSGMLFPGHLSNATLHGRPWLTGGSAGPEASLIDFLLLFLMFYVVHRLYPSRLKREHAEFPGDYRTNSEANTN
ncbi:MAG: CPBP family intramembrane metalloprotease [Acidobacteriota bacterium]|nr:CPBP family intramembrane metalloprotease [Acidobacteriota bacterium]